MKKTLRILFLILLSLVIILFLFSFRHIPAKITYGVSFSVYHANELKLPWKDVYNALLDDMKVRQFRLSAHWPMIEPREDEFHFAEIDYQMNEAKKRGATVTLAIGRRLPGWPECHEPSWIAVKSNADKEKALLAYIEKIVLRYKDYPNIRYFQVENEPFLKHFAKDYCGPLDTRLLQKEIDLVHSLDPKHPILLTDSGEIGTWGRAYSKGDVFGTSMYLYIWSPTFGQIRYPITPAFFRIKQNIIELFHTNKPSVLIELSTEPWLLEPIVDAPFETLLDRMSVERMKKIINFAKKTGFADQYLWGAEWWYWMKQKGHPEYWEEGREIVSSK